MLSRQDSRRRSRGRWGNYRSRPFYPPVGRTAEKAQRGRFREGRASSFPDRVQEARLAAGKRLGAAEAEVCQELDFLRARRRQREAGSDDGHPPQPPPRHRCPGQSLRFRSNRALAESTDEIEAGPRRTGPPGSTDPEITDRSVSVRRVIDEKGAPATRCASKCYPRTRTRCAILPSSCP